MSTNEKKNSTRIAVIFINKRHLKPYECELYEMKYSVTEYCKAGLCEVRTCQDTLWAWLWLYSASGNLSKREPVFKINLAWFTKIMPLEQSNAMTF